MPETFPIIKLCKSRDLLSLCIMSMFGIAFFLKVLDEFTSDVTESDFCTIAVGMSISQLSTYLYACDICFGTSKQY